MLETELSPSNEKWFSNIEAPQIVDNPDLNQTQIQQLSFAGLMF